MNVQGPFTRIDFEPMDLNSSTQIKNYLLREGWKPTQYNKVKDSVTGQWRQTSPKLTEDSFDSISSGIGQLVVRRSILTHRRNTIKNYKDPDGKGILSKVREDGRVPAEGVLCGTPTARTTHRGAVCNVPKASPKVVLGKEMRSLFCVKGANHIMLGADLDQIEARCTAHWAWHFDAGAYWRVLESVDDIHQYNADLIGSDRDTAKSFQYALTKR